MLYQLSYSGFLDPTMALLVLLLCLELYGFASHSRGDPLITNDVLYQLSYTGVPEGRLPAQRKARKTQCRANCSLWYLLIATWMRRGFGHRLTTHRI